VKITNKLITIHVNSLLINVYSAVYSQSLSACSLFRLEVIHSSSCSWKRPAARKNRDVDKLLVGGVLRPQLR